ncbi:MAG: hypothetical protein GWN93_06200 [Deltaproteobacteria bacterium]|nr:hypothetical protein [Deltaproteobacteria bacterium]
MTRPRTYSARHLSKMFNTIMESAWYTNNGRHVRQLELNLQGRLRVPYFVALSSGTAALEAAVSMLFTEGTVIAIPSFTFVAVASAVVRGGCKPLFVDIDLNTWTMSYDAFKEVKHKVGGVIVANTFGISPDRRFTKVNVPFVYDNAHGYGVHDGIFGDVDVYSFHATKAIGGAEGGGVACATSEQQVYLSRWRDFGHDGTGGTSCIGTNAKMSEFHAVLISGSMMNEGFELSSRYRLLDRYKGKLDGSVRFQVGQPRNCVFLVSNRDSLASELTVHGYDNRPYFYPIHKMHPYWTPAELPVTEYVSDRAIAVPLWGGMGNDVVDGVCEVVLGGNYG